MGGYKLTPLEQRDLKVMDPPAGEYTVRCTVARVVNRTNGGESLVLEWKIVAGDYAGAMCEDWFDFSSEKEVVVQIGEDRLYGIAKAMGRESLDSSDEIVGKVVQVVTKERTWGAGKKSISPSYYRAASKEAQAPVTAETKSKLFAAVTKAHAEGRISDVKKYGGELLLLYGAKDSSDLLEISAQDAIGLADAEGQEA